MMNTKLTDLILHIPNFLNDFECSTLINEFELRNVEGILENCPDAITGIDTFSSYERIVLIKDTDAFDIVHNATEKVINKYIDHLEKFNAFHIGVSRMLKYSHMYRLLRYSTGAKIHPHIDHDLFIYGSCTFNLNDDYEGGEFSFFRGQHKVKLGKGDALIWPADYFWVHEVTEITKGVRYSTNSFLQQVPQSVKQDLQNLTTVLMQREYEAPYNIRTMK